MVLAVGRYAFRETVITPVFGQTVQVARADPARVYLAFSAASSTWNVSTRAALSGTADGIIVNASFNPWELFWQSHGSLVCAQWWGRTGGAFLLTVLELIELE